MAESIFWFQAFLIEYIIGDTGKIILISDEI